MRKLVIILLLLCVVTFSLVGCSGNQEGNVNIPDNSQTENNSSVNDDTNIYENDVDYSQNLAYTISDDKTYYIVRGLGLCSDRDIVIPSTYNKLPVLEIGDNAFEKEQINSVIFTKNVRRVGVKAFSECNNLSKIVFGDNLETISSYAFNKCKKLKEITFGNNDLTINSYAFYWCEELSSINIKNVISIESHAFSECHNLSAVQISSKIDFLSDSAFNGCAKLIYNTYDNCNYLGNDDCRYLVLFKAENQATSCTVFDGTRIILPNAFKDNNSIKNISLPTTLIRIGYSAFRNCKSLLSINIPESVKNIEGYAFEGCEKLNQINFNATNCSVSSSVFANTGNYGEGIKVIISANVTQIPSELFAVDQWNPLFTEASPNIISVEFANDSKCTLIGSLSFSHLEKLSSIILPNSIIKIEGGAFRDCYNLTSVTIGINVKDIASTAFENCYNLTIIKRDS